jgi:anti-sigma B factor antagonist
MSTLRIAQEELRDGIRLIAVVGALDAATADSLIGQLETLFRQNRYRLIVDLSGLEFISSAGMSILLDANETARKNGGNLIVASPSDQVRSVVKILSADKLIPFADTREEAERRLA